MRWTRILIGILALGALAALPVLSQQSGKSEEPAHKTHPTKKTAKNSDQQSEGEKKFQQNCSRCHNAPESFSPRISGTILRHMRVRASLSKQDEEDIFRFLNP